MKIFAKPIFTLLAVSLFGVHAGHVIVKENESKNTKLVNSSRSLRSVSGKLFEDSPVFVQVLEFNNFVTSLFDKFALLRAVNEKHCPAKKNIAWIKDDKNIPSVFKSSTCRHCSPFCVPLRIEVPLLVRRSNCSGIKGSCYTLILRKVAMAYYYKRPY